MWAHIAKDTFPRSLGFSPTYFHIVGSRVRASVYMRALMEFFYYLETLNIIFQKTYGCELRDG
jgi:hypothetical protein